MEAQTCRGVSLGLGDGEALGAGVGVGVESACSDEPGVARMITTDGPLLPSPQERANAISRTANARSDKGRRSFRRKTGNIDVNNGRERFAFRGERMLESPRQWLSSLWVPPHSLSLPSVAYMLMVIRLRLFMSSPTGPQGGDASPEKLP